MGENHGKATKIAYEQAAAKPGVKRRIVQFAEGFKGWTPPERKMQLNALLSIKGISIRPLADDTQIRESTLRCYVDRALQGKGASVPSKQAPVSQPPTAPGPTKPGRPAILQKIPVQKATLKKVVLAPRPQSGVQQRGPSDLAQFILEFLETRGNPLGLRSPTDFVHVLSETRGLLVEVTDPNAVLGTVPTGDERTNLISQTSLGPWGDDFSHCLSLGLRNVLRQLGANKSACNRALDEVEVILKQRDKDQHPQSPSGPDQQPHPHTAQIRWTPGPFSKRPSNWS